jgi:hypothetical protein
MECLAATERIGETIIAALKRENREQVVGDHTVPIRIGSHTTIDRFVDRHGVREIEIPPF